MRTRTNLITSPTSVIVDIKASVRVATAAALAANSRVGNVLTATANASLNTAGIDGVTTLVVGDRVLVKDEATGANKGIYNITSLGAAGAKWVLTRTGDCDESAEVTTGLFTFVEEGTTNASTGWILTTANPITLNTTSLSFTQFTGAGEITAGTNVTKTGNTLSVTGSLTSINGLTTATNTDLTLATLDSNKNVVASPHGTGRFKVGPFTSSAGAFIGADPTGTTYTNLWLGVASPTNANFVISSDGNSTLFGSVGAIRFFPSGSVEKARIAATTGNLLLGGITADGGADKQLQIAGVNKINFGATANATIGMSADTTAGDVQFTGTTTGIFTFNKAIRGNGGFQGSAGTAGLTQASTAVLGKSITVENGLVTAFA